MGHDITGLLLAEEATSSSVMPSPESEGVWWTVSFLQARLAVSDSCAPGGSGAICAGRTRLLERLLPGLQAIWGC